MKFVCHSSLRNTTYADKPNEDYTLVDEPNCILIVLDGVSRDRVDGKYPDPSPAREVTRMLAHDVHSLLAGQIGCDDDVSKTILRSVDAANEKVAAYNKKLGDDFPAGTCGIFCVIRSGILYYAYLGDCFGRLVRESAVMIFTKEQTKLVRENKSGLTNHEIRNIICNNINHPYGYGVLNGDKGAMDFLVTGSFPVHEGDIILLSTDGMEGYLVNETIDNLMKLSSEEMTAKAVARGGKQDDKSIIRGGF